MSLFSLVLSADFDTIDNSVLLERFSSWFGISSTALSRIKSFLRNRSFNVNIENSKSSLFQLLCGTFLKDPSLVLYSSSYAPLFSVLSYLIQQTITSMLMILNFSYHSQLWISLITLKTP